MEELTCATSKGGWEDRSDVSCPAYGFRCGIRQVRRAARVATNSYQATKLLYTSPSRLAGWLELESSGRLRPAGGSKLPVR